MLVIVTAGIAPGLALLSYFYLRDYYGTEPVSIVLRTFLFGAFLVFPLMFLQYVLDAEGLIVNDFMNSFVITGFLEEFFKWFILMYTIYHHVSFDEPYDGVVYGSAVSLGFATAENLFYLLANGVEFAFGRALLPVSSHALFGVIMGYYFGKGKFTVNQKRMFLFLAFLVPFILHGLYDYILLKETHWMYFIVPFMIFLWWLGLSKVKKARILSDIHASQMIN
ncbi:glutamic-type intramembrane protease PrsW [Bacillus massiliigorillae]|uniref:glutamic-type intramembrane protease PrsW n=1 Tax=Bacillus massiliigorillae TaxID=1243664 RepID=UPI00039B6CDB|nr:glutamic-type intramembrane protease PrsW [Bacillus massiliigorillae]